MSVTYRFRDLAALGDFYRQQAERTRERANNDSANINKTRRQEMRIEAAAFDSVADLLRKTKLGEEDDNA